MYTKESLEQLRERIDLLELVSGYVEMKRSGSTYKGLCPFHHEKSPSFILQKADRHYHCFGCGAHGDAIEFLMSHISLSFKEAVELLAEKFHVTLQQSEQEGEKGAGKAALKKACKVAAQFYHAYLLHSPEGKEALTYLFKRGLGPEFLKRFEVGLAPKESALFFKVMRGEKISEEVLLEAGLLTQEKRLPFFRERITFPVRDALGDVIGFSARKYREETYGGKYINSPETPLFKKSRYFFGANFSRRRMAKERKVLLVEGQIDCLRLIEVGLDLTVATLGTAFGKEHVAELQKLGIQTAYLLFDGDEAGQKATSKAGDLLQAFGVEVRVVSLPFGSDPDSFLTQKGTQALIECLKQAEPYLNFQVRYLQKEIDITSPAGKAELVKVMKKQFEEWEDPILVHESLRKLASLLKLPEETMGMQRRFIPNLNLKAEGSTLTINQVNPERILELDLLRWLVYSRDRFMPTAKAYLKATHFHVPECRSLFSTLLEEEKMDSLSIAAHVEDPTLIDELMAKKVNLEQADTLFLETLQKLLDREWMERRERIKMAIHSGSNSEEKILELAKEFDALKSQRLHAQLVGV